MTTKKFTPTITRGPRLTPGEISLTPPDDLGIDIPPSGVQKALPFVMGGCMVGMIAIMLAGLQVAATTTDTSGYYSTTFTVPSGLSGAQTVTAISTS